MWIELFFGFEGESKLFHWLWIVYEASYSFSWVDKMDYRIPNLLALQMLRAQEMHLVFVQAYGENDDNQLDILLTKLRFNDSHNFLDRNMYFVKLVSCAHTHLDSWTHVLIIIDFVNWISTAIYSRCFHLDTIKKNRWNVCGRRCQQLWNRTKNDGNTFIVNGIRVINSQRVNVWAQ